MLGQRQQHHHPSQPGTRRDPDDPRVGQGIAHHGLEDHARGGEVHADQGAYQHPRQPDVPHHPMPLVPGLAEQGVQHLARVERQGAASQGEDGPAQQQHPEGREHQSLVPALFPKISARQRLTGQGSTGAPKTSGWMVAAR